MIVLDRRSLLAVAAATTILPAARAEAAWPNGVIKAICPFPPGSGADLKARWYSNKLAQRLGATVIVENKPGAMGYLATDLAAKAKPDGQTIYINPGASMLAAAPALFKTLRFDPVDDFEHIALLNYSSFALCVPGKTGFQSLSDLTAALRSKTSGGLYGSIAPPSVVFAETYKQRFGLTSQEVKYKEAGPLTADIINGTIDFVCIDLISVAGLVKDGRLRPLAMACEHRMAAVPDVPGASEVGISDFDLKGWWSVEVPAKTPRAICDRLEALFRDIATDKDTIDFLTINGSDPMVGGAKDARDLLIRDMQRWKDYAALAHIEPI